MKRGVWAGNDFLTKPSEGGLGDQSFVGKTGQNGADHQQRRAPDAETSRKSETMSKIGFAALWAVATVAVVFLLTPAFTPALPAFFVCLVFRVAFLAFTLAGFFRARAFARLFCFAATRRLFTGELRRDLDGVVSSAWFGGGGGASKDASWLGSGTDSGSGAGSEGVW